MANGYPYTPQPSQFIPPGTTDFASNALLMVLLGIKRQAEENRRLQDLGRVQAVEEQERTARLGLVGAQTEAQKEATRASQVSTELAQKEEKRKEKLFPLQRAGLEAETESRREATLTSKSQRTLFDLGTDLKKREIDEWKTNEQWRKLMPEQEYNKLKAEVETAIHNNAVAKKQFDNIDKILNIKQRELDLQLQNAEINLQNAKNDAEERKLRVEVLQIQKAQKELEHKREMSLYDLRTKSADIDLVVAKIKLAELERGGLSLEQARIALGVIQDARQTVLESIAPPKPEPTPKEMHSIVSINAIAIRDVIREMGFDPTVFVRKFIAGFRLNPDDFPEVFGTITPSGLPVPQPVAPQPPGPSLGQSLRGTAREAPGVVRDISRSVSGVPSAVSEKIFQPIVGTAREAPGVVRDILQKIPEGRLSPIQSAEERYSSIITEPDTSIRIEKVAKWVAYYRPLIGDKSIREIVERAVSRRKYAR